ncbi:MAG TPA: rhodanese-like domain-containing protein [Ilumatobacter sp.]|nr:rhodanese-like domain-containing protein [Ilumatobacter sp.]
MAGRPEVHPIDAQVRAAKAVVENLRPADLAAELEAGEVVLVDVRGPDELWRGMISGAISVPRGILERVASPDRDVGPSALDPRRRVVVYSEHGSRSALVVHALYSLGYRDVAHLDGGVTAWMADGRTVVAPAGAE